MRISIIFTLLITSVISINGQQLYIEAGKSISSFNYKNSQGKRLDNIHSTDHIFMSLGFRKNIFTKKLFLNLSGNYNNYGAAGSDKELDNYFDWDLSYLGLGLGLDYYVYTASKIGFYIKGALSAEFLIQGTQTLNNQVFNIRKEEDFDSPIYFLRGGAGAEYTASDKLTFFTQYMYGNGGLFKNRQGRLKINDHRFGIGLLINISKMKPVIITVDNSNLDELKMELETNSRKIKELEENSRQVDVLKKQISDKEKEIRSIKESISNALQPYNGTDLIIKEVQGKVYITMGSDLLFKSGSLEINKEGMKALTDLGNVLAKNSGMNILIEGHTDNQPFRNANMNNWDLSVKRATAIVEILRANPNINPKNLTAAGRGEYDPIATNSTMEGREKNRRIEIIITPNLAELSKEINN